MTAEAGLDHEKMWNYLRDLLGRVCGALDGDSVMADALDAIIELCNADRGLVLLADADGTTQALVGRRQKRAMHPLEREEISKTFVREVIDTGQYIRFDALLQQQNPSASVASLGIAAALVAPLAIGKGARLRGALYLDYRDRRRVVDDKQVELFFTAASVFGLLLEQEHRSETVRGELAEMKRHSVEARSGATLDELLDFPSLTRLRDEVRTALVSTAPMLVLGESGSGKTMLAHAIAEASGRRPVVRVMLGASDDLNLITSELFGHERGAFTGASGKRIGLVEVAHGGTLVLDELLNLAPAAQRLFLDFVQFGTYRPLGYERPEPKRGDVRIIAATNGDVQGAIREGRLREDLYHRLAHIEVEMPPLRARREDIPVLADRFLKRVDPSRSWTLSLDVRRMLVSPTLTWSGNIRQLERVILRARERAVARDPGTTTLVVGHFEARDLGAETAAVAQTLAVEDGGTVANRWQRLQTARARLDDDEKDILREAVNTARGVVAHAARDLGVARTTLSGRLAALGVKEPKG